MILAVFDSSSPLVIFMLSNDDVPFLFVACFCFCNFSFDKFQHNNQFSCIFPLFFFSSLKDSFMYDEKNRAFNAFLFISRFIFDCAFHISFESLYCCDMHVLLFIHNWRVCFVDLLLKKEEISSKDSLKKGNKKCKS